MNNSARLHTIGDLLDGRENNFNLLRFIAATLVIWSHSYALLPNGMASDPIAKILGFGFAGIAVNSFFAISGFLIVRSYLTHNNLRIYAQARILRILPGLVVAVLFCAFVIGPLFTTLPLREYFGHPRIWDFVSSNIGLYNRVPTLPGVFSSNDSIGVNGSLWTLSYEISMYIAVAVLGVTGLLRSNRGIALVCFAYIAYFLFVTGHPELAAQWFTPNTDKYQRLSLYFFLGGCLFVFRNKIPLHGGLALALWVLTLVAYKSPLFKFLFTFALTYSVFWFAFVPRGRLLGFNSFDDYSYGIYIYAFPVQQALIARYSGMSEVPLFFAAFFVTLALAWLSCKLVEKPAQRINSHLTRRFYAGRTRAEAATPAQP